MRFRPLPKPEPYRDTSRKRAAFKRKQRLEREALLLFSEMIAAGQHSVDEEMASRHIWWNEREREQRALRAAKWREARARLFALPDQLRRSSAISGAPVPIRRTRPTFWTCFIRSGSVRSIHPGRHGFSTAS
jgi:hypothetical protein